MPPWRPGSPRTFLALAAFTLLGACAKRAGAAPAAGAARNSAANLGADPHCVPAVQPGRRADLDRHGFGARDPMLICVRHLAARVDEQVGA